MSKNQKVFTIMGRNGDILIALPAFRYLADLDGAKPKVITSSRFGGIFSGVSYVDPVILEDSTGENYTLAKAYARDHKLTPRYIRWWMAGENADWTDAPIKPGDSTLVYKGAQWRGNFTRWPSYQSAVFDRTGVDLDLMNKLPLVFDRRNRERESALLARVQKKNKGKLPLLLFSTIGHSSPFPSRPEVIHHLQKWRDKFHLVDLADVQGEQIYDLLGVFDAARLLVTVDTAHLHLAAATKLRFIAYLNDANGGWSSSIPSKNCLTTIKYSNSLKRLDKLKTWVSSAYNT